MKEILLALICQEFEVLEDDLLSESRHHTIQDPLTLMTYMLVVNNSCTISEVHKFYVSKGFVKTRASLYHHLKRARRNLKIQEFRNIQSSLAEGVDIALNTGMIVNMADEKLHEIRGRIMAKLIALDNPLYLSRVEKQLNTYLKTDFINTKQFESKEKKAWVS